MQNATDLPMGKRIELLRLRRGMSREVLAALVGRSAEWLRQVEKGHHPVDRLSVLLRLGEVLQITDMPAFLGLRDAGSRRATDGDARYTPVHSLLLTYWLEHAYPDGPPPSEHWDRWRNASHRYSLTLAALPTLLAASNGSAGPAACGEQLEDPSERASAHRLAAVVLTRTGSSRLALLEADRGMGEALGTDTATQADCGKEYGMALLENGFSRDARRWFDLLLNRLSERSDLGPASMAAIGGVLLGAALAAAADGDRPSADLSLRRARELAQSVPASAEFGEAVVAAHEIRVNARLGHTRYALGLADRSDFGTNLNRDLRVQFLLDLASARLKHGDVVATAFNLLQVEEACVEEFRFNTEARALVCTLISKDNGIIKSTLWELAERAAII